MTEERRCAACGERIVSLAWCVRISVGVGSEKRERLYCGSDCLVQGEQGPADEAARYWDTVEFQPGVPHA